MAKREPIETARYVRAKRAVVLTELKEGSRYLRKTLLHPPACLHGATIYSVLESTHGMGPETSKSVLLLAKIWPLTDLGHLHPQQVERIIENLPERIK